MTLEHPENWVDLFGDDLFRFAISRVNDEEIAKDLVQDTFLASLKNNENFRNESSLKTWLFSILKNKIIDHYREKSRRGTFEEQDEWVNLQFKKNGHWNMTGAPRSWAKNPLDELEKKDFRKALDECRRKLKDIQNAAFTMKYMDEMDSEQVCKELNITPSNFWVLIHRAKMSLRKCLESNWSN